MLSILLASVLFASPASAASLFDQELATCGLKNPHCRSYATCKAAYACEKTLLRQISRAWYWNKAFGTKAAVEACASAHETQKFTIEALDTTIECMDTPNGPHFGG